MKINAVEIVRRSCDLQFRARTIGAACEAPICDGFPRDLRELVWRRKSLRPMKAEGYRVRLPLCRRLCSLVGLFDDGLVRSKPRLTNIGVEAGHPYRFILGPLGPHPAVVPATPMLRKS